MTETKPYKPKNKIRLVTATSLFDGHDAAINIMRRILQASGAEVIHLGHDRSANEVVETAIQEDVQAIAVTSYQGGHMEYFKYIFDLLKKQNAGHIKIFGGGGGVILPEEIEALHAYGITHIYSPDDGRSLGLQGMINHLLENCDFGLGKNFSYKKEDIKPENPLAIARLISAAENFPKIAAPVLNELKDRAQKNRTPVLGITGTGGAGKSSLTDELLRRFLTHYPEMRFAIISVDPSKRKSGGALLGDRIRMNSIYNSRVYMRSLATRRANKALSEHIKEAILILQAAGFDLIVLESSGIGQSSSEILDFSNLALYVMTPEFGAATQLEKIDMLDFADLVAINKSDKRGAEDALRDVQKQYQRNHTLWDARVEDMPVFATMASQFNDSGVNKLYQALATKLKLETGVAPDEILKESASLSIIPPARVRYLSEIGEKVLWWNEQTQIQSRLAQQLFAIFTTLELFGWVTTDDVEEGLEIKTKKEKVPSAETPLFERLFGEYQRIKSEIWPENRQKLVLWNQIKQDYGKEEFAYNVRGKEIKVAAKTKSLAHLKIPKIAFPSYRSWGERLSWLMQENVPGEFPYTAGVFRFKRQGEDPTRMFAGEGGPERTNRRFHYVSLDQPAKRLSTAFDSVTLYGRNPDLRPDIYGKTGNAGVSVCCLDDIKKLYSGFDLTDPKTSVSMTINGPAPMILAFYLNAAIDQQCEKYIRTEGLQEEVTKKIKQKWQNTEAPAYVGQLPEGNNGLGLLLLGISGDEVLPRITYDIIKADTLSKVRGTVQADILKEDQAQNTCIFSTEFALRLMGDVQQYFIDHKIQNFYSVSVSGYHIAEAGANPITQLAFTLANGFTYLEYYLNRGMKIDDFAPNLSFFFSNGLDPEYAVIGRVARRIWAKAMKLKYKAGARSQRLKYHIQTSGRSLHAQEIDFNDIRTTLQALYAIYDNCNSLHTNAYDEAITTPTEESVRRAMAIQLIINKELGLTRNENPLQGSFIIEELTDLVEEAVLIEFDRLTDRGGVLGAMETMYQRSKIQEESLYYETLKHKGELEVVGVNTFLSSKGSPVIRPAEVIRATEAEKKVQINTLKNLHQGYSKKAEKALVSLQYVAERGDNIFDELMEAVKVCSLGQLTEALFAVGGQYRRNM